MNSQEILMQIEEKKAALQSYITKRANKLDEKRAELAKLMLEDRCCTSINYKRSEIYNHKLRTNQKCEALRAEIFMLEREFDYAVIDETETEELCVGCFCSVCDCECVTDPKKETPVCNAYDEKSIEEYLRKTVTVWFDTVCSFAKACGRTWRQLATNVGELILVNNRPSVPRCYLHTLVNFEGITLYDQIRAKIALEEGKNNATV